jgi:steroid 5-alpha reductase family enzyme
MPPIANSTLLTVFVIDAAIQIVFYIHAAIFKTEKWYDFSGALTNLSCALVSLLLRPEGQQISELSGRQITASIFVCVWCIRLGTYLFYRILRTKDDKRFDELKKNPISFAVPWSLQIVWIYLTALCVWIINGNDAREMRGWWAVDYVGIVVWVIGFGWEATADWQKNAFKVGWKR